MLKLESLSTSYKTEQNVDKKNLSSKMTRQNSLDGKISIRQVAHPNTQKTSHNESTTPKFLATNFDISKLCNISNHHFNTMCMDILKRCHENDCTINADGTI